MTVREIALVMLAGLLVSLGSGCTSNEAESGLDSNAIQLAGAGATFPAPLYEKWLDVYQKQNPVVQLSYEAIGSGDGTKQFMAGSVDFGASDAAMKDEEIAKVESGVQLVPVVAGSIVLAYNLEGIGGDLKLPRDVYVDIFLNEITTWDDPRIQAANPGLKLPSDNIALAVRQDSSGTTFAFTNHLSAISDKWRDRGSGVGKVIDWPGNAMAARGNEGVAGRIVQSVSSIGYVEYGTAQRAGLKMAWLENQAGQFIQPHGGSGLATLLNVDMPENLRVFFPDPAGADSYPIVTYSWLLLNKGRYKIKLSQPT
ncbi:phosphate ABC transporter substrate-binding protein PstS [Candidatus Entotheonella serta]|nr:phosphate ABC transporter substrate-binding protein PstS [Candidatus Entotheonella serta]